MSAAFKLKPYRAKERDEQAALFRYAAIQSRTDPRWRLLYAIPNGMAASSIQEARRAKESGLRAGIPDLCLPVQSCGFPGLYVELKRSGGNFSDLSQAQRDWIQALADQGYKTVVAFGWKHAVEEIHSYLSTSTSTNIDHDS